MFQGDAPEDSQEITYTLKERSCRRLHKKRTAKDKEVVTRQTGSKAKTSNSRDQEINGVNKGPHRKMLILIMVQVLLDMEEGQSACQLRKINIRTPCAIQDPFKLQFIHYQDKHMHFQHKRKLSNNKQKRMPSIRRLSKLTVVKMEYEVLAKHTHGFFLP